MPKKTNTTKPKKTPRRKSDRPPEAMTWPEIVRDAFKQCHGGIGAARLEELYAIVEQHPRAKVATNKHIRAKVRQVLETSDQFVWFRKGTWALRSKLSAEQVARLNAMRRELYPRKREAKR